VHFAPESPKKNTGYCTRIFEIQRPRKTPSLSLLVDLLAVEGDTESAEQESAISVVCGGGVDGDVETGDHLGRVPVEHNMSVSCLLPTRLSRAEAVKTYMS